MEILQETEFIPVSKFDREMRESALPIWFESLVGIDWTLLHISPVYFGFGVPKGDGSAVILVPGLLGSDFYLYELYLWLARIGYKPYFSSIGWNADCLNILSDKLTQIIRQAREETGKKVHLIGHSLGGILSRSAAARNLDLVESVITLASPFRGVRAHPRVLEMSERIRRRIFARTDKTEYPNCYTGFCNCPAVNALHEFLPKQIRQTAVFTKTDGIVDWRACRLDARESDFEVTGTHIGLVYNYQVYKILASRLAEI